MYFIYQQSHYSNSSRELTEFTSTNCSYSKKKGADSIIIVVETFSYMDRKFLRGKWPS